MINMAKDTAFLTGKIPEKNDDFDESSQNMCDILNGADTIFGEIDGKLTASNAGINSTTNTINGIISELTDISNTIGVINEDVLISIHENLDMLNPMIPEFIEEVETLKTDAQEYVDMANDGYEEVTHAILRGIELSNTPRTMCFDATKIYMYILNIFVNKSGSVDSTVDVIEVSNGRMVKNIVLFTGEYSGRALIEMCCDIENNRIYVGNIGSGDVFIIQHDADPYLLTSISMFVVDSMVYDPINHYMYISGASTINSNRSIYVYDCSTITYANIITYIYDQTFPIMVYDSFHHRVYSINNYHIMGFDCNTFQLLYDISESLFYVKDASYINKDSSILILIDSYGTLDGVIVKYDTNNNVIISGHGDVPSGRVLFNLNTGSGVWNPNRLSEYDEINDSVYITGYEYGEMWYGGHWDFDGFNYYYHEGNSMPCYDSYMGTIDCSVALGSSEWCSFLYNFPRYANSPYEDLYCKFPAFISSPAHIIYNDGKFYIIDRYAKSMTIMIL
jgi:hypothetical protein